MIVSYRDAKTERFAKGARVKEFSGFARQAEKRLDRLEAATSLQDLAALPGNALEPLRCDRKGQYSIRINEQDITERRDRPASTGSSRGCARATLHG